MGRTRVHARLSRVTSYVVDPERSTVSVVPRPRLDGADPLSATISGRVELATSEPGPATGAVGSVVIDVAGVPRPQLQIDLAASAPELTRDHDDQLVLDGSAIVPAGDLGLRGSPLLNPTILLRWRLVLLPAD
jgi:hypothetical protein